MPFDPIIQQVLANWRQAEAELERQDDEPDTEPVTCADASVRFEVPNTRKTGGH
jgi:hypothetical protein